MTTPEPGNASLTKADKFERFHAANPELYREIVRQARELIEATGARRISMQGLIEVARHRIQIVTRRTDSYKINNDVAAFYARLVAHQEDDLADVFERRSSPEADRWIAMVKHGLHAA